MCMSAAQGIRTGWGSSLSPHRSCQYPGGYLGFADQLCSIKHESIVMLQNSEGLLVHAVQEALLLW